MEITEIKELAKGKGKLDYYGSDSVNLNRLEKITRDKAVLLSTFFRAKNTKLITNNVVSVEGECAGNTPLNKIPKEEKRTFIASGSMKFEGTAIGVVRIEEAKYLEIEIIPDELYLYSWVYGRSRRTFLKVVS